MIPASPKRACQGLFGRVFLRPSGESRTAIAPHRECRWGIVPHPFCSRRGRRFASGMLSSTPDWRKSPGVALPPGGPCDRLLAEREKWRVQACGAGSGKVAMVLAGHATRVRGKRLLFVLARHTPSSAAPTAGLTGASRRLILIERRRRSWRGIKASGWVSEVIPQSRGPVSGSNSSSFREARLPDMGEDPWLEQTTNT
jgi:hypothetical protein